MLRILLLPLVIAFGGPALIMAVLGMWIIVLKPCFFPRMTLREMFELNFMVMLHLEALPFILVFLLFGCVVAALSWALDKCGCCKPRTNPPVPEDELDREEVPVSGDGLGNQDEIRDPASSL